jgi:hypothetical protein
MSTQSRTLRTPAERAIAALGVEQRRVERLREKHIRLDAELDAVLAELGKAERRLTYAEANPDLPEANTDPIPGVD